MSINIPMTFPSAVEHITGRNSGVFITVEGNIGVGKSTFCHKLTQIRGENARHLAEPVDKTSFRSLLGKYYAEPSRWGFTFQMYALKERFKQHTLAAELAANGLDVIQDRAIYSDGCFGRLVHLDDNMSREEWDIYADTFGALKRFLRYPDVMIYLRADPSVCHERTKRRGRGEEAGIPIDYLRRLHNEHEALAEAMSRFTRVVVFDWNDYNQDVSLVNNKVNEVLGEEVRFMRDFCKL